ncbi:MAG: Gfo/Idh/MocA family protein, partial [Thermoguttaceae bacterium]
MERNDIEVVGIATPDHWHVKIAIEALLAGKHVFCQKPLTLTIEENKLIRNAVKKTNKVFQVGTQQRLMKDHFMLSTLMVRKGLLGDIRRIVVYLDTGPKGGPFQTAPVPDSLDWNMFLGQAPYVEYRRERAAGTFRYWYEYSGGQFTDWGAHHIDCALWAVDQLGPGRGVVEVDGKDVVHASPLDEKGYPQFDDRYSTAVNFNIVTKFANGVELVVQDKP